MKNKALLFVLICLIAMPGMAIAEKVLKVGISTEVMAIDPHFRDSNMNSAMMKHMYDNLIVADSKRNLSPSLAVSWKSLDSLTWELQLRQGVKFHDGSSFTSEDVVYSIKRVRQVPDFGHRVSDIADVYATGKFTVVIKTSIPSPVPRNLTMFTIVSKKNAEGMAVKDFNSGKAAIGTGPFKFVKWVPGSELVMVKNPNCWSGAPYWDKVIFKPMTQPVTRTAALLSGDVDIIDAVPGTEIKRIKKSSKFKVVSTAAYRMIYFLPDMVRDQSPFIRDNNGQLMNKNPLKDRRVRLAISTSINRDAIKAKIMSGQSATTGQWVNRGLLHYYKDLEPPAYSVKEAKQLMAEAGYADGFQMTIHSPNNRYINDSKITQAVGQMLSKIGIDVTVETMPKNVYFPRGDKQEFSFFMMGLYAGTGHIPTLLDSAGHTRNKDRSRGAANYSFYSNPVYDAAVRLARMLPEGIPAEVEAAKLALHIFFGQDIGSIPIHHQLASWGMRKGLAYEARPDIYTLAYEVTEE
jgi:peptide/nickel transport system substrate-binding protein